MQKYTLKVDVRKKEVYNINYKKDLNPEQYKVVTEAEGPCLVLAGPGSGKTRTLIYRLAYILENDVPAKNILLMTFTNKASREMQNRLELLLKTKFIDLWCGTFHHIGNRSIRMYAKHLCLSDDFGILDEEDQRCLIRICTKSLKMPFGSVKPFPSPVVIQAIITYSRNAKENIEKTVLNRYPHLVNFIDEIKKIYRLYERKKKKSNTLDYDDLLTSWICLLETIPSVHERFTRQFRYILVDEYQDTNRLQFDIIKLLWTYHKNILVVGDDAQSIYSFRAADIHNIMDFPSCFKGTKIFKLQTNYRSASPILNLANQIIQKNQNQFHKVLVSMRKDEFCEKPNLIPVRDLHAQSAFISQRIFEIREKEEIPLNEIAVLYRAHYQSAELEFELIKQGIPYIIRGGIRFFEQAHIKDVLSYLRIIQNPKDEISWLRALSLHPGIGSGYADKISQKFLNSRLSITDVSKSKSFTFLPKKAQEGFEGFKKILAQISENTAFEHPHIMIQKILEYGYETYILSNFENGRDRLDDIKELANFAHSYKDLKEFLTDITLREGFRGETVMRTANAGEEHLILSTIHQAKGLEWKIIFIIGLCDGQFPHPKSFEEPAQLEEERRLFYVAVTRAKDRIYLLHPMTRFDYNYGAILARPSLFLQEIPEGCYEKWEIIEEPLYGDT